LACRRSPDRCFFAQRPQIQERLAERILLALQTLLETDNVAVSISAVHFCVRARGVMDSNSKTTTTALGGAFKLSPETRKECLAGLGRPAA
jgi:GTP cyclohydrolase I